MDAAVDAYLQETPGRMEALEKAVEGGDWKAVEREAHGIKSGSRNIRADHFGALLETVEQAGREGRGDDVRCGDSRFENGVQAGNGLPKRTRIVS